MNRIAGFFGGGKKSTNEDGMGPEKTDLAVGGENFGGGDFGGPGSMAAPRVGGAPPARPRRRPSSSAPSSPSSSALVQQVIAKLTRCPSTRACRRSPTPLQRASAPASTCRGRHRHVGVVLGRSTKKARAVAHARGEVMLALRASRRLFFGASLLALLRRFVARALRGGGLGAPELAAAAALRAHAERAPPVAAKRCRGPAGESFSFSSSSSSSSRNGGRSWRRAHQQSVDPALVAERGLGRALVRPAANWASTVASAPKPTLSPRFLCSTWRSAPCSFLPRPLPSDQPMDAMSLRDTARRRRSGRRARLFILGWSLRRESSRTVLRCAALAVVAAACSGVGA